MEEFYRARYYEPGSGRFLSEDPIGFAGGVNKFSYTRNRAINAIDPMGFADENSNKPVKPNFTGPNGQQFYCDYGVCTPFDGKGGPNIRLPDFYQCQCSVGAKCTKGAGPGLSLTIDRNSRAYGSAGASGGYSSKLLSCSCTANWLGPALGSPPTPEELTQFITDPSYSVAMGPGPIVQYSWNSSGMSQGIGFGTPQFGGGYSTSGQLEFLNDMTPYPQHEHFMSGW